MSSASIAHALWALFASLLAVSGYLFFAACELGIAPPFEYRYCKTGPSAEELAREKEHQRVLLARLNEAQVLYAQLPGCKQPELVLPKRKDELEGCWQSVRGDIRFKSVDTGEYTGSARICYCFGKNGAGKVRQIFTEGPDSGSVCETGLLAKLRPDELIVQHPTIPCTKGSNVSAATIICRRAPDGSASCEFNWESNKQGYSSPAEKFQRATIEDCGWRPGE